jgi:hypothetical protein
VGNHYEVVFSVFIRDDAPDEVLAELRWHLGLSAERPPALVVDYDGPQLRPDLQSSWMPGSETATLTRQHLYNKGGVEHHAWGLYVRVMWGDDQWSEVWWQFAALLAKWAAEDGYAGFFREYFDQHPTAIVFRNGDFEIGDKRTNT